MYLYYYDFQKLKKDKTKTGNDPMQSVTKHF